MTIIMDRSKDPDNLHGDTVVAELHIQLRRDGSMAIGGSVTDEVYVKLMLDTAQQAMAEYHNQRRAGRRADIMVPAYDTALVGTVWERKLLGARDELANAMSGGY